MYSDRSEALNVIYLVNQTLLILCFIIIMSVLYIIIMGNGLFMLACTLCSIYEFPNNNVIWGDGWIYFHNCCFRRNPPLYLNNEQEGEYRLALPHENLYFCVTDILTHVQDHNKVATMEITSFVCLISFVSIHYPLCFLCKFLMKTFQSISQNTS